MEGRRLAAQECLLGMEGLYDRRKAEEVISFRRRY